MYIYYFFNNYHMIDILAIVVYIVISVIIGCFLLSGFFGIIINNAELIIKEKINDNGEITNNSMDSLSIYDIGKNQNTIVERFLYWIYLINSGYMYVHAYSNFENDKEEYENPANLIFLNLGGIFVFFTTINPSFCKRCFYDFIFLFIYIIIYIFSLHFNILSSTRLNHIVLTYDNVKSWDFFSWCVVLFLTIYLSFFFFLKFFDFALKSVYIFKFYITLFILFFLTVLFVSILYIKIHQNTLHIHHYFFGLNLIIYTASFYHPSDDKKIFLNPLIIHILTLVTQAILLGIIIDGISNFGVKTIYY